MTDISMRILLTGFEPFGDISVNPSMEVVQALSSMTFGGTVVDTLILPVSFEQAPRKLRQWLNLHAEYDYIVSLGVARKRTHLSIERVAINCMDASKQDNDGLTPHDQPVVPNAPAAYFSTLPIKKMKTWFDSETDCPIKISNTAGTYVCNAVFYAALHELAHRNALTQCGFIHLPSYQCMPLPEMVGCVARLVSRLIEKEQFDYL